MQGRGLGKRWTNHKRAGMDDASGRPSAELGTHRGRAFVNDITALPSPPPLQSRPSLSTSSGCRSLLSRSPECCRPRDQPPQWLCEVRRHHSEHPHRNPSSQHPQPNPPRLCSPTARAPPPSCPPPPPSPPSPPTRRPALLRALPERLPR